MNSNPIFSVHIPTKILFGCGELKKLATEKLPGKKALIVISGGTAMKKYGYLDKVIGLLKENNVTSIVFDKILPNPIKSHVMEAATVCRENQCDFVVGLGGGSSIDSAKSIAVMACNEGDYWDYINGGTGKGRPVTKALPVVAIPTTAGTGTEADPWTVITNEERQEKIGFGNELTFPVLSIVDPELMVSIPPHLTAYQGFDAFFHAAEGFIANCATPISDLYALEAIRLLYKYLPVAVKDGKDLKARAKVAWASTLAGLVEATSSCTSEHSLEHAMSAYYPELPHGAGLIAISENYFETFRNDSMKRYMKMAEIMTQQKSNRPSDFIDALVRMQKECDVYGLKLSIWGLKEEDFPKMVQNARETMGGLFLFDPRPMTDEEVLNIYKKSYR
ncbi:MAG TPA: iron-containing alcohol dehydrogenase [Candidatus Phocaeicola gallinarum]|uniref:Iron-containing alcohol dehydrogenase n=1 Tax=Bacteroides caecicola TaxID=1462569 RepID=A0ABS2FAQ4_9BACE|nr:iron-containing alcohol dehydrogenase [Bacteroides caecicola]MBM6807352.1 iron-containing alcohol dehydrogenase [Bacteroides caecicola]MCL1625975.1 iron-containing alcohol dehydrogenase [Bacteroides caecicola]HJC95741.1 iron-containing alcohol dehydrogenase [Candidatus Phocaeicola gallinarum]